MLELGDKRNPVLTPFGTIFRTDFWDGSQSISCKIEPHLSGYPIDSFVPRTYGIIATGIWIFPEPTPSIKRSITTHVCSESCFRSSNGNHKARVDLK